MAKKWRFKFADVEIQARRIIACSLVNYKQLERQFKEQLGELNGEIKAMLGTLFEKKRVRIDNITPEQQELLDDAFTAIARIEGVQADEVPEIEPEVDPELEKER